MKSHTKFFDKKVLTDVKMKPSKFVGGKKMKGLEDMKKLACKGKHSYK